MMLKKDGYYVCAGCGKKIKESASRVIPVCKSCAKRKRISNLLRWNID